MTIPHGPAAVHWWLHYAALFRRWGNLRLARVNANAAHVELKWWGPVPLPK